MSPSEKVRAMLDERGVEYGSGFGGDTLWTGRDGIDWRWDKQEDTLAVYSHKITPEQAIAATVGNGTDLASRLREVTGLHAFAELFGFDWSDESDWDWHDVACAMADAIDATAGAGTCRRIYHPNRITKTCTCSNCGYGASDERWAYCPKCGHKYMHGEVEEWWKSVGRKVAE